MGTRRWRRLLSVAVGRNDLRNTSRQNAMHAEGVPQYPFCWATLSESINGVCIVNRRSACGVPTATERWPRCGHDLHVLCYLLCQAFFVFFGFLKRGPLLIDLLFPKPPEICNRSFGACFLFVWSMLLVLRDVCSGEGGAMRWKSKLT